MKMKRKKCNSNLIILLWIGLVIAFFSLFSEVRSTLQTKDVGRCVNVAIFGKLELKRVDRMVVSLNGAEVTVTDPTVIDKIVSETTVATHGAIHDGNDGKIELYRGDKLQRSMGWSACCDVVQVYEADLTHWVIGHPEINNAGCVYLSSELVEELKLLLADAK